MAAPVFVNLEPEEIYFRDVRLSQVYVQTLRVTNTLRGPIELTIKPGSSERYTVAPSSLRLRGGETGSVEVRLRVLRFAQKQKAVEQGQRDVFHVKGSHFDQKFYATFWLAPDAEQPGRPKAASAGGASTSAPGRGRVSDGGSSPSRSPGASPRARKEARKSVTFAEPSSPHSGWRSGAAGPASTLGGGSADERLSLGAASAPLGVSASIDMGQLHEQTAGARLGLPIGAFRGAASCGGGGGDGGFDGMDEPRVSRLPRATSRSLPASPRFGLAPEQHSRETSSTDVPSDMGAAAAAAAPTAWMPPARASSTSTPSTSAGGAAQPLPRSATAPTHEADGMRLSGPEAPQSQPSRSISPARAHLTRMGIPGFPAAGDMPHSSRSEESTQRASLDSVPYRSLSSGGGGLAGAAAAEWQRRPVPRSQEGGLEEEQENMRFLEAEARACRPDLIRGDAAAPAPGLRPQSSSELPALPRYSLKSLSPRPSYCNEYGLSAASSARSRSPEALLRPPPSRVSSTVVEPRTAAGQEQEGGAGGSGVAEGRMQSDGGSSRGRYPVSRGPEGPTFQQLRQLGRSSRSAAGAAATEEQEQAAPAAAQPRARRMSDGDAAGRMPYRFDATSAHAGPAAAGLAVGGHRGASGGGAMEGGSLEAPAWVSESEGSTAELQLQVRALERQQVSMRRTIEQQQELIRDKSSVLQLLQVQLERAKTELAERAASRADPDVEAATSERSALVKERATLTTRLAQAEAALASSRQEAAALRRLQLELQSRQPDVARAVDAALLQEHALQEEQNRKALELLMEKDGRIQELEDQVSELQRGNERLSSLVSELRERMQTAESQVMDVLRQKEALVEAAEQDRRQAERIVADLERRLALSNSATSELLAARERIAAAEQRALDAERGLALAEARAAEAESRVQGSIEAMRGQYLQQQDDQLEAMAEELQLRSSALQEQHAEAMRRTEDAHQREVTELQTRISELIQELARVASGPGDGGAKDRTSSPPRDLAAATNARLAAEVELLRQQLTSSTWSSKERALELAELDRLRTLLTERDLEAADLTSQLQVLRARLDAATAQGQTLCPCCCNTGAACSTPSASPSRARDHSGVLGSPDRGRELQPSGERGCWPRSRSAERDAAGNGEQVDAVVEALRKQLARSQAELRGVQERLAVVEARAAVAQETAGKGAVHLEAANRNMVGSTLEIQRLQQELESSRATATRLNGKINDLVLAEQLARAEVEAAKSKLGRLQELHSSEVAALQQRMRCVVEHLAATQPEVLPVLLGPEYMAGLPAPAHQVRVPSQSMDGPHAPNGIVPCGGDPGLAAPLEAAGHGSVLNRERELEKALDAAETSMSVLQSRLLAALKAAADAGEEAARVRREAEWERERLEAEVRTAREEGSLRIRTLEESVARLGARGGEASQAMARCVTELDGAVRREHRMRSELALAQQAAQRANTQAAELRLQLRDCEQALREAQVYGGLLPFLHEVATAGTDEATNASSGAAAAAVAIATSQASGAARPSPRGASTPGAAAGANAPFPGRPPTVPGPRPNNPAGGAAEASVGGAGAAARFHVIDAQLEAKLRQQAEQLARRQQVIARLVDIAEQAQAEAAATQAELHALQQAMPDPNQPLQHQYAALQHRLGATEAELRTCRDAKSACELEVARVAQQLAERSKELDAAAERLAACERDIAAKEDAAARKAVEVRGAMSKEVALLSRRCAETQRAADEAEAKARELDTQLGSLRTELAQARAELDAQTGELRQVKLKSKEEKRAVEDALRQARRSADVAKQEAEERRSQLAVLMETIEVLQAGNPGEREQRIVSLTAQLSAATSRESSAEQRAQGLLADAEASTFRAQQLESEVSELKQQVGRLEQQLATCVSNRMMLEGELAAVRSDVRSRDAAALRAARELDDREQRLASFEGEVEALRRVLNESQGRHADLLAREREESATAVRQARAESSKAAAAASQAARLDRFQASLDELVAWIEARAQQQPPAPADSAAGGAPPAAVNQAMGALIPTGSWLIATLERLKGLALESEREYLAAGAEARTYRIESRWAWARVQRLQIALEQRTSEWQVAEARVQQLERTVARRSEEAAIHALEQVALQDKQLSALQERLQATTTKLVVATSQAAGAEASLTAARATLAALQRQLAVAAAERRELLARLAAADMETAGSSEVLHLGAEAALAQRDVSIRQYLDEQLATLVAKPDVRDKVMSLAREVCALKLSESQLQAALAASRHRGDAATQLIASLTAALRASEEVAERVVSGVASDGGANGDASAPQPLANGGAGGSAVEVAQLSAQLVAQSHEVFRLQEAALRSKQAYERRETDLQEFQAQVAASELLLSHVKAENSAALLALKEQLGEAHEQDRQLLMREIRELQARLAATRDLASRDVELAEQRAIEISTAANAEIEERVSAATAGQVDASQLHEVETRAVLAERKVSHLETQLEALQAALTASQAQIADLEDVRDVTGAAVASLEATLARIEKAAASGAAGGASRASGASASGSRRTISMGGQPGEDAGTSGGQHVQGLASLSRELVRAKMSEAEAVRKMRAAARSEVDLRQTLLLRDERISELKEELAARMRALEDLRRRAHPPELAARGLPSVAGCGPSPRPALRSRSPSPVRAGTGGARPGTAPAPAPAALSRRPSAGPSPAELRALADAADVEHLSGQVAKLRVELAKKQAEVERLQGALAEANAAAAVRTEAPRPPPAAAAKPSGQASNAAMDRLKDQLASANAEIATAISTANSLLSRLSQFVPEAGGSVAAVGAAAPKRAGSPARPPSAAAAMGTAALGIVPQDGQLAPGTLAGVMQQLAHALQTALHEAKSRTKAVAAVPAGPSRSSEARSSDGGSSAPTSSANEDEAGHNPRQQPHASDLLLLLDELSRLKQDYAALERQRDEVLSRCSRSEGEVQRCRSLVQELLRSAAEGSACAAAGAPEERGGQVSKLQGATQVAKLLEHSVAALHQLCDSVQAAVDPASGAAGASGSMQQAVAGLSSELATLDTTVGVLKMQLSKAVQDLSVYALGPDLASPSTAQQAHASQPRPEGLRAGGDQTGGSGASASRDARGQAEATGSSRSADSSVGQRQGQEEAARPTDHAAALAVARAHAATLATATAQQKARAEKWKRRSKELGAQLSLLNASTAAREAAVSERLVASGLHIEEELRKCKAEAARLQAALSGAEAARRELEAVQSSGSSEARANNARAAEALARAATLQRQLETERAQAAAAAASHQEEVAALKAAVAQEKGERARLLVSLRESHSQAQQAGDTEARLRNDMLEAHSAAAAARATAERAEERALAWREEANTLRQRLQQMEQARAQLLESLESLESRLEGVERRAAESGEAAAARIEELAAKLAEAQAESAAAPARAEARLRELEGQLADMLSRLEAARQSAQSSVEAALRSAQSSVQASRWSSLTRLVRYQSALKQLQADLEARQAEWEREKAVLQATAHDAARRAEALAAELEGLQRQMSELQVAGEMERQQLAARHVTHIKDMQERIEQERQAMATEAAARAEAAAAASQNAAEAVAASRLAALEAEYGQRLEQLEADRAALAQEIQMMQAQFSQYQTQKAAEVSSLEQRLRGCIETGAVGVCPVRRAAASCGDHAPDCPSPGPSEAACHRPHGGGNLRNCKSLRRQHACSGSRAARRRKAGCPGAAAAAAPQPTCTFVPTLFPPLPTQPASDGATNPRAAGGPGGAGGPGAVQLTPSQLVALARGSEALEAAQREVAFERSLRGRVEAQVGLLRGALARVRGKLKAVSDQLDAARASAVPPEEHRQLQAELSACREQLKSCRAESARRQKALQLLQGMAIGPSGAAFDPHDSAAAMRGRVNRPGSAAAAGSAAPGRAPLAPPHAGGMMGYGSNTAAFSGSPYDGADMHGAPGRFAAGRDDDPLPAALEAAAAGARATAAALEAERAAREAVEGKLREAKSALERKTALAKDLKRRVDDLSAALQRRTSAASEDAAAESRLRSLTATLTRKEALVKELRERLEAVQASVSASSAAAEARSSEELEAAKRASARLRTELAKRDVTIHTALNDLEKERTILSGTVKQLEDVTRRETALRRQAGSAAAVLRGRARELLEALRALSRVLLQAVAAMDVASERLHRAGCVPAPGTRRPVGAAAAAAAAGAGGGSSGAAQRGSGAGGGIMSAHDISQLTSLSIEDVRHLLGPEDGGGAAPGSRGGYYPLSHGATAAGGAAVAASLEAAQRVGDLLSVIEVSLAAAADMAVPLDQDHTRGFPDDVSSADGELLRDQLLSAVAAAADPAAAAAAVLSSRSSRSGRSQTQGPDASRAATARRASGMGPAAGPANPNPWDIRTLQALVEEAQAEAQRAEGGLAAALQSVGVLG